MILHGHFYQPPRENPRTGIIGKQPSAGPYSDWNERIHADCYSANCHSRYLSPYRRVLSMTNNYAYISFNFGPTLLSWIEAEHPDTYQNILEADLQSLRRLGSGNAIAQGFNHSILPLNMVEDAKIQILWGLEDFYRRFNRPAEGLWLPETAINPTVIDLLAECGVTFVILSPWQCRAISKDGKTIEQLNGRPAPYDRPFLLEGKSGKTVTAFFYNHHLAEGISFGHYLRDADQLYQNLVAIRTSDKPDLIHTATDGEIYGHHEPYGDMALAALIQKVEQRSDFTMTNYGAYLKSHPAVERAFLHDGEEGRGTSWSCSHGVSRWYRDCGCHTGGDESWNQKWRTPLRRAFDQMALRLDRIFTTEIRTLLGPSVDPQQLLASFAPVAGQLQEMESFVSQLSEDPTTRHKLALLLLGQKYKHFSFTSCGWFFNDLAGLEPKQNIIYAIMAVQCYRPFADDRLMIELLDDLSQAKANRKQDGTGRDLAMEVLQQLPGELEAALFFNLDRLFGNKQKNYGWFDLLSIYNQEPKVCRIELYNRQSLSRYICTMTDLSAKLLTIEYSASINDPCDGQTRDYRLDADDITARMRDILFKRIEYAVCSFDHFEIKGLKQYLNLYASLSPNAPYLAMSSLHQQLFGSSIDVIKRFFMTHTVYGWEQFNQDFSFFLDFLLKYARQNERDLLKSLFEAELLEVAEMIGTEQLNESSIRFLLEFLQMIRSRGFQPDLLTIQNAVYPYLSGSRSMSQQVDSQLLVQLSDVLNFDLSFS